jgi:hypothetical protein
VAAGFGFLPGIDIGLYFGGWGGWGWGGWGWGPNWFGGGIFIDYSFLHRYGFGEFHGGLGRGVWAHRPLIAAQPRLVWEIPGSSSAHTPGTTAFLADITMAG